MANGGQPFTLWLPYFRRYYGVLLRRWRKRPESNRRFLHCAMQVGATPRASVSPIRSGQAATGSLNRF